MLKFVQEVNKMNITQFIRQNEKLKDLPFLVVFRTIQVLVEQGEINRFRDVERVQS